MKQTKIVVLAALVVALGSLSAQAQVLYKANVSLTCTRTNETGKFVTKKLTNKDILKQCVASSEVTNNMFVVWNDDDKEIQVWQVDKTQGTNQECSVASLDFSSGTNVIVETDTSSGSIDTAKETGVGIGALYGVDDPGNLLGVEFTGSIVWKESFVDKFNNDTDVEVTTLSSTANMQAMKNDIICTGTLTITGKGLFIQ